MDVGLKPGFGVAVGVADVVAAHAGFKTKFTSHSLSLASKASVPGKRKRNATISDFYNDLKVNTPAG